MTVLLFDARRKLSWLEWELEYYRGLFPQLVRAGVKSADDADRELAVIQSIRDDYRLLVAEDQGVPAMSGLHG